jgi:poly(hydroxyalkanoate) depolymerase family esterase
MKLNEDFLKKMNEATQLLQTSGSAAATAAIQRALQGAGSGTADVDAFSDQFVDISPAPGKAGATPNGILNRLRNLFDRTANPLARQPVHDVDLDEALQKDAPGKFLPGSCTNRAGTRAYKIYIPSGYNGEPLPLIVMLHGCKQNPDDFAAGTGMNRIAEENNCFVVYPAQAPNANGSNCWNWFNASDQKRDAGEPSIIADTTRQVMREYRINPDRVYVAGLSAGGAMATILAAAYPELYAAVGIHSGLPAGSAHNVASAFGAMKDGGKAARLRPYRQVVPAIVFHGDRDHTVHPSNGVGALAQCMSPFVDAGCDETKSHEASTVIGQVPQGHAYTRKIYNGEEGAAIAEHWIVHGAGHAWSGGSKAGSYTDPKGPDASREMVRFFYAHPMPRVGGLMAAIALKLRGQS